jgi:transglutaminase-like putative cysteine protease
VLTAALARLYGIPARVVVGVALVSDGKEFSAFGHAWAETLENGKWVVADAAMRGFTQTVRYVPVGLIEDEGMGYSMGLAGLTRKWIRRVVVLGPGN